MAEQKHFVLVHGACHGGWCWYKVKPRLQAAGHRVTVLDLTASGVNMVKSITDVETVEEYSQPLMEIMASLDADDHKVILVGHSLGGLNIALAMEKYPERIEVAVFLTAFAPDTVHEPSHVLDQFVERMPMEAWLDTEFSTYGCNSDEPKTAIFFGPKFLAKLYHLSPPENLELALSLTRPSSLFREDLSKAKKFSNEGYGSVRKVFVICKEDQGIPEQFQRWTIENGGFENVMAIEDADHMPMFSKPNQLCECLVDIARF